MKFKKFLSLFLVMVLVFSFVGCKAKDEARSTVNQTTGKDNKKIGKSMDEIDAGKLKGTTICIKTHSGNRVLGEEKKDDKGNTCRDESSAYLKFLAEDFTRKYGINVKLDVVTNEDELRPLFQVKDSSVDIFTCPNWSLEEWSSYAEPYCTVEEAAKLYGDYAYSMPQKDGIIYSLMPAKAYNQAICYNEEVIRAAGYDKIPATLDEFNKMCEAIKTNKATPISLHRVENWPLATVQDFATYVSGDPYVFPAMIKTANPFSTNAPFGKTIKMYTEWKAKGFFEQDQYTDFGVAMDSVAYGKAAMMLFGSWVVPQIQGRVPKGKDPSIIKFAPAPDFGAGRYVQTAPADNYAISKFSEKKDAARLFIEYLSQDAQFIANCGFIANKKNVAPIVPILYSIIDNMVKNGECKTLMVPASDKNYVNTQEILTEAGLWADYKYVGLLFDSLDITKPDNWAAYDKQVKLQNKQFEEYKKELGVKWTIPNAQ